MFDYDYNCCCDRCDDLMTEKDYERNNGLCDDCFLKRHDKELREYINLENVTRWAETEYAKSTVKINPFFDYVYSWDEIENLILRDFEAMPEEKQNEYLTSFLNDADEYDTPAVKFIHYMRGQKVGA